MSADIISPLLQWLNMHPHMAGLVTFIISAAESIAIIGTIVPGSITMTAIGALAGAGIIPLWGTIIWAIIGAVVGDGVSYWIGFYFKHRLSRIWPFRQNPQFLENGEAFVQKHGGKSVFIGRFVGPVRALVPVVAGMLGMRPLHFTIANVASAILWAPAYMLPGILLGAASLELPPDIALHVMLVLLLMMLFVILCIWLTVQILYLVHNHTNRLFNWVWHSMRKSRVFSMATIILKHHDPKKTHGQLTLAFYLLITTFTLVLLARFIAHTHSSQIFINDAIFHLFRSIRVPSFDHYMISITLLGQKEILLSCIALLFFWLLYKKRAYAAWHLLSLGIATELVAFAVKQTVCSPRPWGLAHKLSSYSFPSGHTTFAVAFYLGIAFLLAQGVSRKHHRAIYTFALVPITLISISRLYLNAHWFTDVLGGWLLGAILFMLFILSYQRKKEPLIPTLNLFAMTLLALALPYAYFSYQHLSQLKIDYTQAEWPTFRASLDTWWQQHDLLSNNHRVSLFGFPSQRINLEWAGKLETIKKTLLKEGWEIPPERDWGSVLHRISGIESSEYLPLVSPDYLDKKPVLILTRRIKNQKKLLALQLWQANVVFNHAPPLPLWVGTIGIVPRAYSWLSPKRSTIIDIEFSIVFPKGISHQPWEWRYLPLTDTHKKPYSYNILLVKPKR